MVWEDHSQSVQLGHDNLTEAKEGRSLSEILQQSGVWKSGGLALLHMYLCSLGQSSWLWGSVSPSTKLFRWAHCPLSSGNGRWLDGTWFTEIHSHLPLSAVCHLPSTTVWKQKILLTYCVKVSSNLILRHNAYVTDLMSPHHIGILSSHIRTKRRVNIVQEDILRERKTAHSHNLYCSMLL